jgi:hypothetical protein
MVEQVLDRRKSLCLELFGDARADAFDELQLRVKLDSHMSMLPQPPAPSLLSM